MPGRARSPINWLPTASPDPLLTAQYTRRIVAATQSSRVDCSSFWVVRMSRLFQKVEFAANVSIIAVSVLLAVVLIRQQLTVRTVYPENIESQASHLGSKVTVAGIDWNQNRQTLLLAISSTCRYCTESSDFYKRLLKERVDTRIVAVMPQEPTAAKQYLDKHAIPLNETKQLALSALGVTGTPTLILVDTKGVVTGWWVGKLTSIQEAEVLAKLKSPV